MVVVQPLQQYCILIYGYILINGLLIIASP